MKDKLKGMIIGLLVGMCLMGGSVMAINGTMTQEVTYRNIKITLDGEKLRPTDANGDSVEPFIIDGTTYLPVRAVAEALGLDVKWNNRTSTVVLTTDDDYYDDDYYDDNDDVDYYDSIYDILTCEETYIDFETGETVTLDTMADVNDNYEGVANKYCFIDLDNDDVDEVVVEFTREGGYAVFNYNEDDDEWYCYYAAFDEVMELKTDGTMRWEESDEVFGTQSFLFTNGGMKRYVVVYVNDEDGEYSICDIPVTRNNCTIDLRAQDDKPDAKFKKLSSLK